MGLIFIIFASTAASASDVTIMAVGDILPQASWQKFCIPVGELFKNVNTTFYAADAVIGNLETPLTKNTEPTPNKDPESVKNGKDFVFKCTSNAAAQALKDAGFTALTLANNHMMDYNGEGLTDTLDKLGNVGIKTAGAGRNIGEAENFALIEAGGMRLVLFSASDVVPKDYEATKARPGIASIKDDNAMLANIVMAREIYPDAVIIICAHWGVEATYTPTARQKLLAHEFIEAGADLILGSHPHRVQGVEFFRGKPIFYSLGNFQFDTKGLGNETFIAKLTYKDGSLSPDSVSVMPVFIETGGYPRVLGQDEPGYRTMLKRVDDLSNPLGAALTGEVILPAAKKAASY